MHCDALGALGIAWHTIRGRPIVIVMASRKPSPWTGFESTGLNRQGVASEDTTTINARQECNAVAINGE
jgi:hypothetical protein